MPAYEPAADNYLPYQQTNVVNVRSWDPGSLVATFEKVRTDPTLKGFVFVHCKRGNDQDCSKVQNKIARAARMVMGPETNRLDVAIGGYTNRNEVETFLIGKDSPNAMARPAYPR